MFGICQGCPFSPFLFSIVLTCIMADATEKLQEVFTEAVYDRMSDLLYADDTLLLVANAAGLTLFLGAVAECGLECRLSLNLGKIQALNVRTQATVTGPDGPSIFEIDGVSRPPSEFLQQGRA